MRPGWAQLIQSYDGGETGRFGRQLNSIPLLFQSPNGFGPFGFRALFGRRTRAQVEAFEWSTDPAPWLDAGLPFPFSWADTDLVD